MGLLPLPNKKLPFEWKYDAYEDYTYELRLTFSAQSCDYHFGRVTETLSKTFGSRTIEKKVDLPRSMNWYVFKQTKSMVTPCKLDMLKEHIHPITMNLDHAYFDTTKPEDWQLIVLIKGKWKPLGGTHGPVAD